MFWEKYRAVPPCCDWSINFLDMAPVRFGKFLYSPQLCQEVCTGTAPSRKTAPCLQRAHHCTLTICVHTDWFL